MKDLFTNKEGKYSLTAVAFAAGFMVCTLKLLLAGLTVGKISVGAFSGSDYGVAIAALGGVYVLRRNVSNGGNGSSS